jgi:hypothetical protein
MQNGDLVDGFAVVEEMEWRVDVSSCVRAEGYALDVAAASLNGGNCTAAEGRISWVPLNSGFELVGQVDEALVVHCERRSDSDAVQT